MDKSAQLHLICSRLSRAIPPAYHPPPKPTKTWQRLKVSDVLVLRQSWRLPKLQLWAGQRVRVARLDSAGMVLCGEPWDWEWRWEDPNWSAWFEKAPTTRRPRTKPNKLVDATVGVL